MTAPAAPTILPDILEDIHRFDDMLARYHAGDVDDEDFRAFRLANGIYGQRQGGSNHMVRVKIPYGAVDSSQLRAFALIAGEFSRGWGHLTTRQNLQFHFVDLERIPRVLRILGAVGLTTREACGDTVRTVQGCHLAGACPLEVLNVSPWAEAVTHHLLRNPIAQRLPRKMKINFSGCDVDCGQAMFNDVGVVATSRSLPDGGTEPGFRVYLGGGLGASPRAAVALEPFTRREDLMATVEAAVRVFDATGNRTNRLRARFKWVLKASGAEDVRRAILELRDDPDVKGTWPAGVPKRVLATGDAPTLADPAVRANHRRDVAVTIASRDPYRRWRDANVITGRPDGTASVYARVKLGDITAAGFTALAEIQDDFDADVRVTNRQNLVFRGIEESRVRALHGRLDAISMADPGAELLRDIVSCPGADTCNLAVTQSRGLAKAIEDALDEEGLAEVGGIRVNISGCSNSCGHHHVADIGFHGVERRSHDRALPGYQMLVGGHLGDEEVRFGTRVGKVPAKATPVAVARVVRAFVEERRAGETFHSWLARRGGAKSLHPLVADLLDPPSPLDAPDFYVDYDEITPFRVSLGASECG